MDEFTRDELKFIEALVQTYQDNLLDEKDSCEDVGELPTGAIMSGLKLCDDVLQIIGRKLGG